MKNKSETHTLAVNIFRLKKKETKYAQEKNKNK